MGGGSVTSSGKGASGGKGIGDVLNPLPNLIGTDAANAINPSVGIAQQSLENTGNWISGKEEFGAHDNWFGSGPLSDHANTTMGGSTTAQRAQKAKTEENNQQAWKDWAEKTGKKNPYGTVITHETPRKSLLFGNEEEDNDLI